MISRQDFDNEVQRLLDYLEARRLTEQTACAIMGTAITALIENPRTMEYFIATLRRAHTKAEQDTCH